MMNRHSIAAAALGLALCFQARIVSAQSEVLTPGGQPSEQVVTNGLNRLGLSVRIGYNINARFRSTGSTSLHAAGSTTPHGDPYNYDDGYVLRDSSGSAHNQTWYWGYNNLSQINPDNSISMHRHALAANPASGADGGVDSDDVNPGAELTYNRELGRVGKLRFGLEAAVNYLNIFFHSSGVSAGNVTETTDTFYPAPLTTIPTNSLPYRGNFTGPNFVITNTPFSSVMAGAGSATVRNQHEFNADIWGFRLGPYLEYPMTTNLDLSISGGLALALVDDSASWSQSVTLPGFGKIGDSGGGDRFGFMWGFYARGNVAWRFSENWFLNGGIQYQDVGQLHHQFRSQTVDLDLSKSLFFTGGIAYRF